MILSGNEMKNSKETRSRGRALACAALFALALAACDKTPETPLAPKELLELKPDGVLYDSNTSVTNGDGIRTSKINSDTAYYFQDSTAIHMVGVHMEVYNDQGPNAGAVKATVTADQGRYDQRTQAMHAAGHVVLIMPNDGRRVESAELYYEPQSQRIWSDSASTYTNKGQVTRGTCFKSDLTFKNYNICNIRGAADIGGAGTGG